jgi:hypothetical protein
VIPSSHAVPVIAFLRNGVPVCHTGLLVKNACFIKERNVFHSGLVLPEYYVWKIGKFEGQ